MKFFLSLLICAFGLALAPSELVAQLFSIDSFALDGGGGASSGGDFELNASIGQHDAGGDMLGGDFAVTGGFWSIVTNVETNGAPALAVRMAGSNALITWPENTSAGFALEATSALTNPSGSAVWTLVNVTPDLSNGVKSVRLPITAGSHFYRLRKP